MPLVESPTKMDSMPASPASRSRRRSDAKSRETKLPARHQSLNANSHNTSPSPHRSYTVDHSSSSHREVTESRTHTTSRTHSESSSLSHQNPAAPRPLAAGSIGPNSAKSGQQTRVHPIPLNATSLSSRPLHGGSLNPSVQNPILVQSVSERSAASAPRRAFASTDGHSSSFVPSQPSTSSHTSANLRMHPVSRVVPGSTSRITSGANSDREVNGHLDLKRLLSKPALPSQSGSSIISIPSDSELPPRRAMTIHDLTVPPRKLSLSAPSRPRERMPPTKSASAPQPGRNTSVQRVSPPSSSKESDRDAPPKPRNVLRRKTSTHSNIATPTAPTIFDDLPETPRPASTLRPSTNVSQASRSLGSSSKRPMTQPVLGAVPMRGFKPKETSSPANLTPAGAVAHAYKQQEQRREEIETESCRCLWAVVGFFF